jgi:arabinose-5-phosphate isomerase
LNYDKNILETAKSTILTESDAIRNLVNLLDKDFENTVRSILRSNGRVILTGIGKSAIIANKIAAITGNKESFLGQNVDFVLNSYVEKEACPNNLAPTSSTTAQLVIGDALAICLLNLNDFSSKDFARYHPGGSLGKKLYLRVDELAEANEVPSVQKDTPIKDVIIEISKKRLGTTAVIENELIIGIITDGDIRRMLENNSNIHQLTAKDIMGRTPIILDGNTMAIKALDIMRKNDITQILITKNDKYIGVVHFHDLIKEGII